MQRTILLVDDDSDQLELLVAMIEREPDFRSISTTSPKAAIELARSEVPDAIVTDLVMPGLSGIELTQTLRFEYPTLPIIVLTGRGEVADEAFAAGATDFMTKPAERSGLIARIRRALAQAPTRELLLAATQQGFDSAAILGRHPRVAQVRSFVQQVAAVARVPALLLGESGTGKNLVARAIHATSPRAAHRFVEINCAALPAALLEAELFGYEKGAFTDAKQRKRGLAEVADGGTLFLDEIGSMPPEVQAKLLTFLEARSFRRLGATEDIAVELSVIAATNADLEEAVRNGSFREDLFYRLNVASIQLPALREIREDIPILALHFVHKAAEYFRRPVPEVHPDGFAALQSYDWPGNARELRNVVERAMIFSSEGSLQLHPPLADVAKATPEVDGITLPYTLTLDEVERRYIEAILTQTRGKVSEAAERLGVTRRVFWARRRKHGLVGDQGET